MSRQTSNTSKPNQRRIPLAGIRERVARAVFPEGFFFDRDTSREIDRLIALVESLGGRV